MKFDSFKKIALVAALALTPTMYSLAENDLSVDDIMIKADHATRKAFSTQLSTTRITTCKYRIVEGKVKCSEKARVVLTENVKKVDIINGLYNARLLSIVREPSSDKGSSLLVYEYGEKGRENDNWVYLPALAKVNRIIANEDEGGSVFGSEFSVETTENPDSRKVYEYTYKLIEESTYQNRPVWVIEITPKPERARKTRYQKVVAWIDKQTFLTLKEDLYRNGKVYKQRIQSGMKKIDGVYVVTKVVMNNLGTSRISQMDKTAMRHNVAVDPEFLSQRALTDFAFRERRMPMANGVSLGQPQVFQCPNCREFINTTMTHCSYCGVSVDAHAAHTAAQNQQVVASACHDANYAKILARAFAAALKQASVTTVALSGNPGTKPLRIDTPRTDEVMAATLIKPPQATPTAKENDSFKTSIAAPQETGEAPQRLTAVLPQGHDFKTTVAAEPSAGDYKTTVAAEPLPSGDDFKTTVAADPLPSTGDYKTTIAAEPIAGDYKTTIAADPIAGDYKTTVAVEPLPGADEFKTLVGAPLAFDTVITDAPPAPPRDEYATLVPEPPAPKSAAPKPAAGGTELISAPPTNTAQLFEGTELLSASAPVAEVKPEPVSNRAKLEKQNKPDKSGKPGKKDKKDKPAPVADSGQLVEVPHTAVVSAAPVKKSGSQIVLLTGLAAVVLVGAFVAWKFLTKDNQPAPTPSQPVTQVSPAPVAAVPPGMVLIPGGEFKVGRDDGEENERPAHTVIVAPFYLDQHEVTNEQYLKFIEATGYLRPPSWLGQRYPAATDKLPVTDVTWEDANEYARWASKRLPTEEEWEIAARGADGRVYPWGNDWADDLANVPKDAADKRQLAPVGTYLRGQSFYGVLDLVGNAWEWTASDYKEYAGGKPLTIPEGYQNLKVIRGCSHGCTAKQATATYRRGWPASRKDWPDGTPANYMQTGFRCAQDAPQK